MNSLVMSYLKFGYQQSNMIFPVRQAKCFGNCKLEKCALSYNKDYLFIVDVS